MLAPAPLALADPGSFSGTPATIAIRFIFDILCFTFYMAAFLYYARIRSRGRLLRAHETAAWGRRLNRGEPSRYSPEAGQAG